MSDQPQAEPTVERVDNHGVSYLSLNRPDKLNALSPALFVELRAHIDRLAGEATSIGVVVLRGNGRSFSAGNDLKAIQAGERAPTPHFQADTLCAIEELPQPVICSVRGHCLTGALELALAGDLIIASDTARFADTHGKWAMTPTWGMSQRLPRRVGPHKALEWMLTGRTIDGAEAAASGLANLCVPDDALDETTREWAEQIAANSWHTLAADKMLVRGALDRGLEEGLRFERQNSPGRGPDMEERLKAFGR